MGRPETAGTLIVGAGQAGLQLATSLRDLGTTDRITLVGAEPVAPYQRPPLSKAYLHGSAPASVELRGVEFYRDHDVDLVCGDSVQSIRLNEDLSGTGEAMTSNGRRLAFDRLALTLGGAARRLDVPGADLDGVHVLRDLHDAQRLRQELPGAHDVVIVGGGFIGLEVAAAARAANKQVTVVEAADRLLARAVGPPVSDFYAAAHQRRGTHILLNTAVVAFSGRGRVRRVELADGTSVPADLVVVGVGLIPHVELAQSIGLDCKGGIVVDQRSRTSLPSIVAAGDCTVRRHAKQGMIRLESVQNAIMQAKVAAATLLGRNPGPTGVVWFWSDQGDLKLQTAGLNAGYDRVVIRGEPSTERFSVLYYCAEDLLAIDAINAPRDYMAVRRILEHGGHIPAGVAPDVSIPLREFIPALS